MTVDIRTSLIDLLNNSHTKVVDNLDHITFSNGHHIAVLLVDEGYCEYFISGEKQAVFRFSRDVMIVALQRALLESI